MFSVRVAHIMGSPNTAGVFLSGPQIYILALINIISYELLFNKFFYYIDFFKGYINVYS